MPAEIVLASVIRGVGGRSDCGTGRKDRWSVIGCHTHTQDDAGMRNNECHKPTAPWVGNENSDGSGVGRADGDITHYLYHFYNPKYTYKIQFVEDALDALNNYNIDS